MTEYDGFNNLGEIQPPDNRWRTVISRIVTLYLLRIEFKVEAKTRDVYKLRLAKKAPGAYLVQK